MIRPGDEWGSPTSAPPDLVVRGSDHDLAAAVAAAAPASLIRFVPHESQIARALGIADVPLDRPEPPARGIALPVDVLRSDDHIVTNTLILGHEPTRLAAHHRRRGVRVVVDAREIFAGDATTVVIANGQFVPGADLVPRGHPGDGWCEVQVYALHPGERRGMRRRLPGGAHLPHPRIVTARARTVEVTTDGREWPLRRDGRAAGRVAHLHAIVVPSAVRLLV